MNAATTDRAA